MQADQPLSEHARRAERAYGAAADHYERAALSFWDRYGAATVARLPLAAGDAVIDLCCGTGASAIPSARAVGPGGRVIGVDLAEPMLELARARAAREGLANVEFRRGDATSAGLPDGGFDAVVCVFGVFFAPDMAAFTAGMWRLVRPGGVLAITTWGPRLFEPANTHFWDCVREVEPALSRRSTRGMKSPPPGPSLSCSRGPAYRAPPPRQSPAGTTLVSRTGSGTSCSGPVTGARSMLCARTSRIGFAGSCWAGCARMASRCCARTWCSGRPNGRDSARGRSAGRPRHRLIRPEAPDPSAG